jgi:DNA ligase-1
MKEFVTLCAEIEKAKSFDEEKNSWVHFLSKATDEDKLWAISLFTKGPPKRIVSGELLKKWIIGESGISQWLFDESYKVVGDLAETLSLIFPSKATDSGICLTSWLELIRTNSNKTEKEKKEFILNALAKQGPFERFIFYKFVTGGFKFKATQKLMCSALAVFLNKDEYQVAQRLAEKWSAETATFQALFIDQNTRDRLSKPYSFQKARRLDELSKELGNPDDWIIEWKWDGIRTQIIKRDFEHFVWLKNEGLITEKLPELSFLKNVQTDGFVLDGVILVYKNDRPLDVQELHRRIKKKKIDKKTLENSPVVFMAFDLLEVNGEDIRSLPLVERKNHLETLYHNQLKHSAIKLTNEVQCDSWKMIRFKRNESRAHRAKGVMLKKKNILYNTVLDNNSWIAFNAKPYSIHAVMIYATVDPGQRSNVFSHFTFGVWDEGILITIAKTGLGLTNTEIVAINEFIKNNTVERFGPVRSIKPSLVFELEFEKISKSPRHKSGLSLHNPTIKAWLKDRHPNDIHKLNDLKAFLNPE